MYRLRATAIRLLNLFRRKRVETELCGQIDAHVGILQEEFLRQGMRPGDARKAAKRSIGNEALTRELMREERFFAGLDSLGRDIQLVFRRLRQAPALTIISIVALASGIGVAAAGWTLVSAVTFDPLPLVDAAGLFVVDRPPKTDPGFLIYTETRTYADYLWLRETGAFDELTAVSRPWTLPVRAAGDLVGTDAAVYFASADFFGTVRVPMSLGRSFSDEDDRSGVPLAAVLSYSFWRTQFAADPEIPGRQLLVGGEPAVVVGVLPRRFTGVEVTRSPDLYLPLHRVGVVNDTDDYLSESVEDPSQAWTSASPLWLRVIGRLPEGTGVDPTEAYLNSISPGDIRRWSLVDIEVAALPLISRAGMDEFSELFGGTVGLLLVIGCMAVGTLLLVRTESRRNELAMCLALGASRVRLARGVILEGLVLGVAGGGLALPVAYWVLTAVGRFELPGRLSIDALELSLDVPTLQATAIVAGAAVVILSLIAGSVVLSVTVTRSVNAQLMTTRQLNGFRLRSALVVGQVAVAVILLVGAGLLGRSIREALSLNPGFDAGRVVVAQVVVDSARSVSRQLEIFADLANRLRFNPDVESVTVFAFGGIGSPGASFLVDGEPVGPLPSTFSPVGVDGSYFTTMGLPLLDGRDFLESDDASAPPVAIVSESLGRVVAGNDSPVGRRIRFPWSDGRDFEIVGVVTDQVSVGNLEPLTIYSPEEQIRLNGLSRTVQVVARGNDVAPAIMAIRSAVGALDEQGEIESMQTLRDQILLGMGAQQFGLSVMGMLGGVSVLLAFVGIYVLAESVARGRQREIGIRAAIGAPGWRLASVVLRENFRLVAMGILVGLVVVWMSAGMIRAFLFRIESFDPVTLGGVSALLLLLALLACLRPVLATWRMDVARILREE